MEQKNPGMRRSIFCSVFLHLTLLFSLPQTQSATSNHTDLLALLAFKNQIITSDPSTLDLTSSWNQSLPFCDWPGVACGRRHRRVTSLTLSGHNLAGSISAILANLTFLRSIHLGNNRLSGVIPEEIGRLFRLRYLNLSSNSFDGKLPANLSRCLNLEVLDLSSNELVGELPAEFGSNLYGLSSLHLNHNNLTGSIPASFGNLSSLVQLSLERNNLEGSIPQEVGQMKRLEHFVIYENMISGPIPSSLFNLSSIRHLDVSVNYLISGRLPSNLGLALPNLDWLMLGANRFEGPIPDSITNASRLGFLDLTDNYFVGPVPSNLGRLKDLKLLTLSGNRLGGKGEVLSDLSFIDSLRNCTSLEILAMESDNFSDVFPTSVANLSTTLQQFLIGGNQIHGSIPPGIENLISLSVLSMFGNFLTGYIPNGIGNLWNLQGLYMNKNQLTGNIPSSFGNLTQLNKLNLAENSLEGSIPSSLKACKYLQDVDFSKNNLNGSIPIEIFSLLSVFHLNISHNSLSGSLPKEVGSLTNLQKLDVSNNRLWGEIPLALGECSSLEYLHMKSNFFQGTIPSSLKSLRSIRNLDLSHNNLSGQIPNFLQEFPIMESLDLSFNDLDGEVPQTGIFKNASAIAMSGNSKLCGGVPVLYMPPCPKRENESSVDLKIIIPVAISAFLIAFSSLFAAFLWRRNSKTIPSHTNLLKDHPWPTVSYGDLLKATDGFSAVNFLGAGSFGTVYKGVLGLDQTVVAVKVLNLQQQGASKSFMAECKALQNIRHRNLVKIVTACSSTDFRGNSFKALVFEYMGNGSLEKWLYPDEEEGEERRSLSLVERLNVAIDVASSLDYLHNHCTTPIVHRDLKPSNVLLDEDMVAHVGDFGLARFLSDQSAISGVINQSSTTEIKGSVGYVGPEYGMGGKASIKADVYSYGILLLEMFTKRRPTDDIFTHGFTLHQFAKQVFSGKAPLQQVVDPHLLLEPEGSQTPNDARIRINHCLTSTIKIGVSCSVESPKERMEMREAVAEIREIKERYQLTMISDAAAPSRL